MPFETISEIIKRLWDGIAMHCHPEHKVLLGFAERLNNTTRVKQRARTDFATRNAATKGPAPACPELYARNDPQDFTKTKNIKRLQSAKS